MGPGASSGERNACRDQSRERCKGERYQGTQGLHARHPEPPAGQLRARSWRGMRGMLGLFACVCQLFLNNLMGWDSQAWLTQSAMSCASCVLCEDSAKPRLVALSAAHSSRQ